MGNNPDELYLQELQHITFQPVFILGLHRSGTSILYTMLSTTGCFNVVTAYDLINYEELVSNHKNNKEAEAKQHLTDQFRQQGISDRGIDRLAITADFTEEYGFHLGRYTNHMRLLTKTTPLLSQLCKKIQYISGNRKPILLKNPYDFSHFLFIKKMFPGAKFIFIHRNPVSTISSTVKAFDEIVNRKNAYTASLSPFYNTWYGHPLLMFPLRLVFSRAPLLGALFLTKYSTWATRYYLRNIHHLSSTDHIDITYEALCEHPEESIQSIMTFLNLPFHQREKITSLMNPRSARIIPSVQKISPFIYSSMKKYCTTFGYMTEGNAAL